MPLHYFCLGRHDPNQLLLVGFDHHKAKARRNAVQALIVTGFGGLLLLLALVWLI